MKALLPLLLRLFTLRHATKAWRQTLAITAIIAIGVGVVLAVRLANRAAAASFTHFTEAVAGSSDWIVTPAAGDFDQTVLRRMRDALAGEAVFLFPVLESTAAEPPEAPSDQMEFGRSSYQILGIDILALRNLSQVYNSARQLLDVPDEFAPVMESRVGRNIFWSVLEADDAVFVAERTARGNGWRVGSRFDVIIEDRFMTLEVSGILPRLEGQPEPAGNLLVMDIAALQRATGRVGRVDRVEVWIENGPQMRERRDHVRDILERTGEGRWVVESPEASRRTGEAMTAAFRLNLSILSLLALAVGAFLVIEALDGAVVRRRQEIAILRSLGVTPRAIRAAWIAESALLGLLGSVLGIIFGAVAAQFAVQLVGRTVNALYFQTTVDAATLVPTEIIGALVLGVAVSVLAGWMPARVAADTPPAELLPRGRVDAGARWALKFWPPILLFLAGLVLLQAPPVQLEGGGRFPLAGYIAAASWLAAAAWLTPGLLGVLAKLARPLASESAVLRLALSRFWRPSGRHRLAVAGLVVAVGMTASMAVMVSSFDATVRGWIGTVLQADLFIASDGAQNASSENRLAESTWRRIAGMEGVREAAPLHAKRISWQGQPTALSGADFGFLARQDAMVWIRRPGVWPIVDDPASDVIPGIVSEAFSNRFNVRTGDVIRLPAEPADLVVRIEGVFADYGNERGTLMIAGAAYVRHFGDTRAATLTVLVEPGVDPDVIAARIQSEFPAVRALSQKHLRTEVFRIFNQTFAITHALEIVGLAVALLGLVLSMASVLLDRKEELTTLRALGMSRRELSRAAAWEGAVVAAASCFGGVLLSGGLGWILIHVINRQSFGWTLTFSPPLLMLAGFTVLVIACGWFVSGLVGHRNASLAVEREG